MPGDDNSGVFVGFPDTGANTDQTSISQGEEIQIDPTDNPAQTTGAIYLEQAADAAARDAGLKPPGQWNAYETRRGQAHRRLPQRREDQRVHERPERIGTPRTSACRCTGRATTSTSATSASRTSPRRRRRLDGDGDPGAGRGRGGRGRPGRGRGRLEVDETPTGEVTLSVDGEALTRSRSRTARPPSRSVRSTPLARSHSRHVRRRRRPRPERGSRCVDRTQEDAADGPAGGDVHRYEGRREQGSSQGVDRAPLRQGELSGRGHPDAARCGRQASGRWRSWPSVPARPGA